MQNVRFPVLVMTTGANQIAGGVATPESQGWLSGDPASLGIGASVTPVFDLGPNWQQYGLLALSIIATQALAAVAAHGADASGTNAQLLASPAGGTPILALGAAGEVVALALPSGRYVRMPITNGAVAQGAGARVRLTAYPS